MFYTATLLNVTFENNSAISTTVGFSREFGSGGGFYAGGSLVMTGTDFVSNTARIYGGGALVYSILVASDGRIENNAAGVSGGGLWVRAALDLSEIQLIRNSAGLGGAVHFAKNISTLRGYPNRIVNSVIVANSAITNGAALNLFNPIIAYDGRSYGGTVEILYTTIASPTVGGVPAIFMAEPYSNTATIHMTDSIVSNYAAGISQTQSVSVVTTSDYNLFYRAPVAEGIITGSHSITDANPVFVNPAGGNYTLRPWSPAADSGVDVGIYTDINGVTRPQPTGGSGYSMGAYEIAWGPKPPTLAVARDGNGAGGVTSNPVGIDCGENCSYEFASSTVVTLTATPLISSTLTGWSGDVSDSSNPLTLTLTADTAVTATFAIRTFVITPTTGANGGITPNTSQTVNYGDERVFTITPNVDYHIADVVVDGVSVGSVDVYTFTAVSANHTISATFAVTGRPLTAHKDGNGAGTVTSDPAGLDCGATCTAEFLPNSVVTVTATPLISSTFTGWSGDASGATNPLVVTMNVTKAITATFTMKTFVITPTAGANGSITPNTAQTVNYGADQVFTIAAEPHYHILDVAADGVSVGVVSAYTFTNVTANHILTASFAIDMHTLAVAKDGTGDGSTALDPTGGNYAYGTVVTVTATPLISSTFSGWSGDAGGATSPVTVTMSANKAVTATFAIKTFVITPTAEAHGSLSPNSPQTVTYGADQVFNVFAAAHYHVADVFVDGLSVGVVDAYTFTNVIADHAISATFAIDTHALTLAKSGTGDGTVASDPPAGSFDYGTVVTVTATPLISSTFTAWSGDASGTVNPITVTMDANKQVTATFTVKTFVITPTAGADGSITPSTPQTVIYGDRKAFQIAPNAHYHTIDVATDGASIGVVDAYTFTDIVADHTISATFSVDTADLVMAKSVEPASATAGSAITYTLNFSNQGNWTALAVVISDIIPYAEVTDLAFAASDPAIIDSLVTPPYNWQLAALPAGGNASITVTGRLTDYLPTGLIFTNTAVITSTTVEVDPASNTSSAAFTVLCPAVYVVNTTADAGPGSLRQALADVCAGGEVIFAPALTSGGAVTITLTSAQLGVTRNVTITGPGAKLVTVSGDGVSRVFTVNAGVAAAMTGLAIQNGYAGRGGGLYNLGALTLSEMIFAENAATSYGGGIYSEGVLTLTNGMVTNNTADDSGGGIFNTVGLLVVKQSTIAGNRAVASGAAFTIVWGPRSPSPTAPSTATWRSPGSVGGGALFNAGPATIANSTFAGNQATATGGAIYNTRHVLTLTQSSLVGNAATIDGGGIYNTDTGTLSFGNTIVANSSVGGDCVNLGVIAENIGNLVEDGTCSPALTGDEGSGALGDYGGPTWTAPLLPGSKAIDAGDATVCLATDQRGVTRPAASCDIGAFESQGFTLTLAGGDNQQMWVLGTFATPDYGHGGGAPLARPGGADCGWAGGLPFPRRAEPRHHRSANSDGCRCQRRRGAGGGGQQDWRELRV
ncbi:MAG: hypothetical protein IPK16_20790, partial [Anaerolineales bacterium]|nr:hypothetical protein [Anaerolineales bacterium]